MNFDKDASPSAPLIVHGVVLLALAALGSTLYANTLHSPFVFDDAQNIEKNEQIRVSSWDAAALYRAAFDSPSPRPVANLSFAANHALGGLDPFGFHVFNIAVHVLKGFLVYLLALRVIPAAARVSRRPASASAARTLAVAVTAAALFVAHPIATQSVTYIVQRMSSLSVFFGTAAFLLYLGAREPRARGRRGVLFGGALVCWLLALGSKQTAASLPFLVLLYEWYFPQDLSSRWLRRWLWPVLGASAAIALLAFLSVRGFAFRYDHRPFEMGERLLTELRVLWFYLGLLVVPAPSRLSRTHDFPVSHSLLDPVTTLLAGLGLVGLLALAALLARRERLASFCILWFFGTLAIESSVISLELVYEQRLYLPMVFLVLLAGEGIYRPWRGRIAALAAVAAVLVTLLGVATVARNEHWRDAVSIWRDAASKNPGDQRALNNLGDALRGAGVWKGRACSSSARWPRRPATSAPGATWRSPCRTWVDSTRPSSATAQHWCWSPAMRSPSATWARPSRRGEIWTARWPPTGGRRRAHRS